MHRQFLLYFEDFERLSHGEYTVGWVCVLVSELNAARALLDEEDEQLQPCDGDENSYLLGRMGHHNVVITFPGSGTYGPISAAQTVTNMLRSFRSIRFGLMVGIGGGAPQPPHSDDTTMDIRLGDIVVSSPKGNHGGVLYYDMGKQKDGGVFEISSHMNKPPKILLKALELLQSDHDFAEGQINEYIEDVARRSMKLPALRKYRFPGRDSDQLFRSEYAHVGGDDCSGCDKAEMEDRIERDFNQPIVHYGLIASGNAVMRSAQRRNELRDLWSVACFEMEAAGLMDDFPCIVIRGICDYSDDHKNKKWQPYAAVVAAAYGKDLLRVIQPREVESAEPVTGMIKELKEDVTAIATVVMKEHNHKLLDWIAPPSYAEQHLDIVEQLQQGTGTWFLESPEFSTWLKTENDTLFCPGIPGAGKTVLASLVIEYLLKLSRQRKIHVMYLYCNYRRAEDQTYEKLIAILLRQLIEQIDILPDQVKSLYNSHAGKITRRSSKDIFKTLLAVIGSLEHVFWVVDALDECTPKVRTELILRLQDFRKKVKTNFLVTSRPIDNIVQHFTDSPHLKIRADKRDVERYIDSQIEQLPHFMRNSTTLQEKIRTQISETVDGMFLLAKLNMNSLSEKMTELEVEDVLENMEKHPADLRSAYGDALTRIETQAEGHRNWAYRILTWLLYARRPLRAVEIQHALAVRLGDRRIELKNLPDIGEVISLCAGLVTLNQESKTIELVHYTTQQFFMSISNPPNWMHEAQQQITAICVTYLSFDVFGTGFCSTDKELDDRLKKNALYDYAARNWGYHAQKTSNNENDVVVGFLEKELHVAASSQAMMASPASLGYRQRATEQMGGLQLAAFFGLTRPMRRFLENGYDLNTVDSNGHTPLFYAAANGHDCAVKLLLAEREVQLNSVATGYRNGRLYSGRTPLSFAAANGHETVVRLLLAKQGIDPNCQATDYADDGKSPLSFAAAKGHELVVKLLLSQEGIDTDSEAVGQHHGRTPLSFAAEKGHKGVVMLLINAEGVNPDSKAGGYGINCGRSPLSFAAGNGHIDVVELLLTKDSVDPDSKSAYGQTPLSFASASGHEMVAKLLLDREDVNPDSVATGYIYKGRTPLSFAAGTGHNTIVKRLLSKGANPNSIDENRHTPLSFAAMEGHEEVVKTLLKDDAVDPDSTATGFYNKRTPLSLAAERGYESIVKLLLAMRGVNPDSVNQTGRTPLSFAASNGHEGVAKLLLSISKVDPDSRDINKRTPLSFAAANGYKNVVSLLLDNDEVDPDSRATGYFNGRTPLSLAAEEGHETVVRLLLARDEVEADSMGYKRQTPLSFAAAGGHEAVVKLLLARSSVNPDSTSHNKQTPLSFAAANGHEEVVKLLLATGKVEADSRASNGRTPLSFAAEKGHEGVAKVLLATKSVNQFAKDSNGQTALSFAAASGHWAVIRLLQEE
ncbi:hypothetical protein TWF281_009111 [Arthrobotrys megalospora]